MRPRRYTEPRFDATDPSRASAGSRAAHVSGPELYLKLEVLQPIGSFKIRGAYNVVRQLPPDAAAATACGRSAPATPRRASRSPRARSARVLGDGDGHRAGHEDPRDRAARRLDRARDLRRMLADGRIARLRPHERALRPPVRRRSVHRRQRHGGLEILEDLPDVDAIVAPLGGGGLLAGIAAAVARAEAGHAGLRRRAGNRRAARRRRSRPAGRSISTTGRRRSSTAPAASRCCRRCGRCSRTLAGSIVVTLDEVARAMRLVAERAHVIAEGAAGCAIAAALSGRAGARQGGRGRVRRQHRSREVRVARRRGMRPTMNRYSRPSAPSRTHRTASTSSPSISGGAGTPKRARCSGGSTTRCGARPRTTRCGCCGSIPRAKLEAARRRSRVPARSTTAPSPRSTTRARRATRGGRSSFPQLAGQSIAYFSAEFALHQSLPIYAGGLGVLAGDHCKEASDLGVPLIGVGFMYPQGYFHQHVSADGWQEESYERLNWADAPIEPALDARRQAVRHRGAARRPIGARGGLARAPRPREALSARHRPRGERALGPRAVGAALRRRSRDARPAGDHPRHRRRARAEGARHRPGGLPPERRARRLRRPAADPRSASSEAPRFDEALEEIRQTTVFTTHTPVPAGHDAFPFHLVEKHLAGCWGTLGPNRDRFLALGVVRQRRRPAVQHDRAGAAVGRRDQRGQPAARRGDARDVGADVAGRARAAAAGRRRSPTACTCRPGSPANIGELFSAASRRRLARASRRSRRCGTACSRSPTRSCGRCARRCGAICSRSSASGRGSAGRSSASARRASSPPGTLLEPGRLTIGFARRFAGYKRPELIFHDPERLARILNAAGRPVQIIFAGKSHPADDIGKHHLQRVYRRALDPLFGGRVAFVDDYDLHVAHFLVQGCDVWLNNPRKPLEASGTSGMKAAHQRRAAPEHRRRLVGRRIQRHQRLADRRRRAGRQHDAVDAADAAALYRLLEEEVVPAFYDRDRAGVPRRWLAIVKESIRTVAPRFSARRMVKEYVERMYAPALERHAVARSVDPDARALEVVSPSSRIP